MAYQILRINQLKKGMDVVVNLGFRTKTLYFASQKIFEKEFAQRMAKAELNVQHDLDQEVYDRAHPSFYSREDLKEMLLARNMITETQTPEDLPTKSAIWANLKNYQNSEVLTLWNKIFKTTLGQPKTITPITSVIK